MKPISIRFRCFGPYMAEQYIDFTRLEENGLFLICGETGAAAVWAAVMAAAPRAGLSEGVVLPRPAHFDSRKSLRSHFRSRIFW